MRIKHTVAAAVAILALAACGSNTAGNAVAGGGVAPTSGGAFGSVVATEPSQPPIPAGPTDSTPTDPTPTDPTPTDPESPTAAVSTAPAESTGPGAGKEALPEDMCDLMPANLSNGLEKNDGDPTYRCNYSSTGSGPFIAVTVLNAGSRLDPEVIAGNPASTKPEPLTVDGRDAFTYVTKTTDQSIAVLDMAGGDGVVEFRYTNGDRTDAQNIDALKTWAAAASKALTAGAPIEGRVAAPPSTTPVKIPAGQRGWPGVVCDVMPEELMMTMEVAKGYEDTRCRLTKETDKTGLTIQLTSSIALREPDPSIGMGRDIKTESFDGRTVYSWITGSEETPAVYVAFSTGERSSAELRYSYFDVTATPNPEDLRAKALELAKQIAPKLPLP